MRNSTKVLLAILLLFSSRAFAQNINDCETIYDSAEQMPFYKNSKEDVYRYFNTQIIPLLRSCQAKEEGLNTKLHVILTIHYTGQVMDVTFPGSQLSDSCKIKLKDKLLTMDDWKPAIMYGKSVCSYFHVRIILSKE